MTAISVDEYLIIPAHVLGAKFEGESDVRICLGAPVDVTRTSLLHRCSSPNERASFAEALIEAVEQVNGVRN